MTQHTDPNMTTLADLLRSDVGEADGTPDLLQCLRDDTDLPTEAEQADFFSRLDLALDDAGVDPESAWKARTIGHLELNPRASRMVVLSCTFVLLAAFAFIGHSWQVAHQPPELLHLPPGYTLIRSSQGTIMAMSDKPVAVGEQEQMRQDALEELQRLLAESQPGHAADVIQVSTVAAPVVTAPY